MNSINDLYRQVIMEHYKSPRNKGLKEDEGYVNLRLKNPSCGDDVTIQAKIENDLITGIRHEGTGCSICCSSASVMSEVLKGKTVKEAEAIINDYYNLIKGEEVLDEDSLDEAIAYRGVANFPARVKCATLAWRALGAILQGQKGEQDVEE
jgi:SUF system NifU family Fe-S assembly protein